MRFGCKRAEQQMHQLFAARQEEVRDKADEERAHHRTDADRAAEQPAGGDKGEVADDTYDAEFLVELLADDKADKVVRSCACVGFDDDAHAEREDDAARSQNGQLQPEIRDVQGKRRGKKRGKEVNDRPAADHAGDGAGHDVRAIDEQEHNDDEQAQRNVRAAVGEKCPAGQLLQRMEHALHQHIKGVCAQIGQQKQRHAEVRDGKAKQQNDEPREQLFDGIFQHNNSPTVIAPTGTVTMIAYGACACNL